MQRFKELLVGTAGVPLSTVDRTTANGIKRVGELGLKSMELEFVRNITVTERLVPEVKKSALDADVALSCHGQYYINLNSLEKAKVEASVERVLNAARRAWECGAFSVTFHAAFYQGVAPSKVYQNVKDSLQEIVKVLNNEGNNIWVRPETTGKMSQFAGIDELLSLSEEIEQVMPCIDFSHLHARTGGKENSYEEFSATLAKVEKSLSKKGLQNMHIHVSGINYTEKGERNHLPLKESDLKYNELMKALHDFKVRGVLICESPNIEEDALLLQKTYNDVKRGVST